MEDMLPKPKIILKLEEKMSDVGRINPRKKL